MITTASKRLRALDPSICTRTKCKAINKSGKIYWMDRSLEWALECYRHLTIWVIPFVKYINTSHGTPKAHQTIKKLTQLSSIPKTTNSKMRSLMILALLSVVCVSSVYSLIRCTDNICDTVRCRMETEEACLGRDVAGRYRFDAKGGFCGCCSACIRVLRK